MSDYPRMMYNEDGRSQTVLDKDQEHEIAGDGWSREPAEIHRRTPGLVPHVPKSGQDDLIETIIRRMRDEFPALTKRGLGRPPQEKDKTDGE